MNKIDELAKMLESGDQVDIELFWKAIVQSSDELWIACETAFIRRDDRVLQGCLAAMEDRQNARELLESIPPYKQPDKQPGIVVNETIDSIVSLLQGTRLAIAVANADESDPTTLVRQVVSECLPELATHFATEPIWTQGISLLSWADDCLCRASYGTNQYVPLIRDVVTRLCKHPRAVRQSVKLTVLYYESEKGYACTLHCEALVSGTGCVFSDPERMTTVAMDFEFAKGLELAWTIAKQSMKRQEPISIDIRYSVLERVSQEPKDRIKSSNLPPPLVGDSMSATLATVFSQLLAGQEIDDHWALTASLDSDIPGRLRSVGGVRAKARALFEKERVNAAMLVCEKDYAEAVHGAREAGIPNPEGKVEEVRNLNEVAETLKALSISRWGPIQALPELNDRFIGRENVIDRARSFIDAPESRYLVLSGGMGRGKTAWMSKLIRNAFDRGERPIFHMIGQNEKAADVGESLKRQLLRKYQHEQINSTDDDKLATILDDVNKHLTKQEKVEVIYIDAVDQLLVDGRAGEFLPGVLPRILPDRIRCIITSRFEQMWYQKARDVLFENLADHADDCKDIRLYLHRCGNALELPLTNEFIDKIVADREHPPSFFTIENCLKKCKTDDSLRTDVSAWLREPEEVIEEAAYDLVKRAESKGFTDSQVWETLGMLALASEPLSRAQLDEMGLWKVGVTDKILKLAASFFKPVQSSSQPFVFDHPGYIRFVLAPEERLVKSQIKEIYQQLLEGCRRWDKLEQSRGYALRQLPQLLIELKNWDKLQELFRNLEYLEARIEFGGQNVAALTADFRKAIAALPIESKYRWQLKLLLEAIQRDSNFIASHPESLFQCMWNSCWWYDCPKAAMYYVSKNGPWNKGGPKLSELLKKWRKIKSKKDSSNYWVRSLRPPVVPLGSRQLAMHRTVTAAVNSVVFHPDGDRVVAGLDNGKLSVWNTKTGDSDTYDCSYQRLNSVVLSDDGRNIAIGDSDQCARVFDYPSMKESKYFKLRSLIDILGSPEDQEEEEERSIDLYLSNLPETPESRYYDHDPPMPPFVTDANTVALSKDGTLLVVGVQDGSVRLFGLENHQEEHVLLGHTGPVTSVAISDDSEFVASGSKDGSIVLWNLHSGRQENVFEVHDDEVTCVRFSPDSKFLVSGSREGTIRIWDVSIGRESNIITRRQAPKSLMIELSVRNVSKFRQEWLESLVEGTTGSCITSISVCSHSNRIVSGSADGKIYMRDATGKLLRTFIGHEASVSSVNFSTDGEQLISGSTDGTIRLWNLVESTNERDLRGHGHSEAIDKIVASNKGDRIATWSRKEETVRLWDAARGTPKAKISRALQMECMSPDGHWLVLYSGGGYLRILNVLSKENRAVLQSASRLLAFSSDGRWIATANENHNDNRIWDAKEFTVRSVLKVSETKSKSPRYQKAMFSPDGNQFMAHAYGRCFVWDVATGNQLLNEVDKIGHSFYFRGNYVIRRNDQGRRRAWDLNTGESKNEEESELADYGEPSIEFHALNERSTYEEFGIPYRELKGLTETYILESHIKYPQIGNQPVATFPHHLENITECKPGRVWAGNVKNHLYLIALEGGPADT